MNIVELNLTLLLLTLVRNKDRIKHKYRMLGQHLKVFEDNNNTVNL